MPRKASIGVLATYKLTDISRTSLRPSGCIGSSSLCWHHRFQTISAAVRFPCKGCPWPYQLELSGVAFLIVHYAIPSKSAIKSCLLPHTGGLAYKNMHSPAKLLKEKQITLWPWTPGVWAVIWSCRGPFSGSLSPQCGYWPVKWAQEPAMFTSIVPPLHLHWPLSYFAVLFAYSLLHIYCLVEFTLKSNFHCQGRILGSWVDMNSRPPLVLPQSRRGSLSMSDSQWAQRAYPCMCPAIS